MSAVPPRGRVALIDRDGTMVYDRVYLDNAAGLEFLPGAAEGLRMLHANGYRLVVVTNQSGIGRGMFPVERLHEMNARLTEMVAQAGASLAGIYFCPHVPEDHCPCRKPEPGLILQAAAELGFDPAAAVVIGDKPSDVESGRRVGALTVLISPDGPAAGERIHADAVAADLAGAAGAILALHGAGRP